MAETQTPDQGVQEVIVGELIADATVAPETEATIPVIEPEVAPAPEPDAPVEDEDDELENLSFLEDEPELTEEETQRRAEQSERDRQFARDRQYQEQQRQQAGQQTQPQAQQTRMPTPAEIVAGLQSDLEEGNITESEYRAHIHSLYSVEMTKVENAKQQAKAYVNGTIDSYLVRIGIQDPDAKDFIIKGITSEKGMRMRLDDPQMLNIPPESLEYIASLHLAARHAKKQYAKTKSGKAQTKPEVKVVAGASPAGAAVSPRQAEVRSIEDVRRKHGF